MAKIRHIAIKVEDQEKTADFYKKTFGMTEAWRGPVRDDGNRAIYLTDGYINMAVLPARGGREGIDHFGFQVENMDETLNVARASGAKADAEKKPKDGRFAEMGVHDPVGQLVDVAVHGWKAHRAPRLRRPPHRCPRAARRSTQRCGRARGHPPPPGPAPHRSPEAPRQPEPQRILSVRWCEPLHRGLHRLQPGALIDNRASQRVLVKRLRPIAPCRVPQNRRSVAGTRAP